MSGLPYPEGVARVIELLDSIAKWETEKSALTARLLADKTRLVEVQEAAAKAWRDYEELMEEMDVSDEGNYGFERRADGVPAELVAPAMGHADTKMVERVYGRLGPEVLANRMAAFFGTPVAQTNADRADKSDSADDAKAAKSAKMVPRAGFEPAHQQVVGDFKTPVLPLPTPRQSKRNRNYDYASGTHVAQLKTVNGGKK